MALSCALAAAAPVAASAATVRLVVASRGALAGGHRLLPGVRVLAVPADRAAATLRALRARPGVRFAERDGTVHADEDPLFGDQWGLSNAGGPPLGGTADADIDAPEAWATGDVGAGVTVAVVDTRVQATHPDLAGGVSAGGDFVLTAADPTGDGYEHGTHVAGIIAARRGDGIGGEGVAPAAQIVAYRALRDDGTGPTSAVAAAMDAAATSGIRIVNLSLGSPQNAQLLSAVVAAHPNTLFVASAGNVAQDVDQAPEYPCSLPEDNVVCVGASDRDDRRASFSNFGAAGVDVFAPGDTILSTVPTDWRPFPTADYSSDPYEYLSGTSMSAPMVSGIAALALARDPGLTAPQLRATIVAGAEPRPGLISVSGGRANAFATVARAGDHDLDGRPNAADACPDVPAATPSGCPDADGDGVVDSADACRLEPAHTRNGCPLAQLRSLRVRVRHIHSRRELRIRLVPTRAATAALRVERRTCRRHRCRYRRVYRRALTLPPAGRTLTVRRVARGRYRIRLVLSSAAGSSPQATRRFRVR